MSAGGAGGDRHTLWRTAYRALLRLLPPALREKQGDAMLALYLRELRWTASNGMLPTCRAGIAGVLDLAWRGVYERAMEERRALTGDTRQHLRHTAQAFAVACGALTLLLVAKVIVNRAGDFPPATLLELSLLSVPYTAALTIPMAVFVAVLWASTHDGVAHPRAATPPAPRSALRLAPVLGLASVLALACAVQNAELVPRANRRLASLYAGQDVVSPTARSMTVAELQANAERVATASAAAPTRESRRALAGYRVETHKKFALAAACLALALLAAGIARRAPHIGVVAQALVSGAVFAAYYVCLIAGEQVAVDDLALSPVLAMWSADFVALGLAVVMLRDPAGGIGMASRSRG